MLRPKRAGKQAGVALVELGQRATNERTGGGLAMDQVQAAAQSAAEDGKESTHD